MGYKHSGEWEMGRVWQGILIFAAVIFLLGSTVLWLGGSLQLFVSPDETANQMFIAQFAQTSRFGIFEQLNQPLDDRIHPRSSVSIGGWILPIGFLGLPTLYGTITKIFGMWVLPFLTPLLALLAIFAFRYCIGLWFGVRLANVTALVLFFHPALWYYSARFLMPNVLFVALVIFAVFFWFRRPFKHRLSPLLSGIFLGLAVFVRASEIYWLAFILLGLFVYFWRTIEKKDLGIFVLGGLLGMLPFFLMNMLTYGHPLLTGYTLPTSSEISMAEVSEGTSNLFFPFGIDLRVSARNVFDYGLALFWWLSIPALIGFVAWDHKRKAYLVIFFALALWLGIWYGSWVIHDNPDSTQVTIANSYVRYWLPIFWLSAPLVAKGLLWIHDRSRHKVMPILIAVVIGFGIQLTFFQGQDGLVSAAAILRRSEDIRTNVLLMVEPDSVIIVDRADKLFTPHRVVYPLRSERTYALMPRILQHTSLYYYGITLPQTDLDYLNDRKLLKDGLLFERIKTFDEESLYRIHK